MSDNKKTFEGNISRLEQIIELLEKGEAPLNECLSLFEEGVNISKDCMDMLDNAEQKIKLLTENEKGSFSESDFIPDGE